MGEVEIWYLSGMTKVLDEVDSWLIMLVDVGLEWAQEGSGGSLEAVEIGPVAMAGELGFLEQVQLGRGGGQPEGVNPLGMLDPPGAGEPRFVVADIAQHQHEALAGHHDGAVIEEGHKRGGVLSGAETPEEPPGSEVQGAEGDEAPVPPAAGTLSGCALSSSSACGPGWPLPASYVGRC